MICAWCRYIISAKHAITDQLGRTYCTEEHRAQYLLAHPMYCDCGCRRPNPTIVIGKRRFCVPIMPHRF